MDSGKAASLPLRDALEELLCLAIPGEDIAPKKRRNLIRQVRKPHSRLLLSPEC